MFYIPFQVSYHLDVDSIRKLHKDIDHLIQEKIDQLEDKWNSFIRDEGQLKTTNLWYYESIESRITEIDELAKDINDQKKDIDNILYCQEETIKYSKCLENHLENVNKYADCLESEIDSELDSLYNYVECVERDSFICFSSLPRITCSKPIELCSKPSCF